MVTTLTVAVRDDGLPLYHKKKNAYVTWRTLCSRDEHTDHVILFICYFSPPPNFQRSTIGYLSNSCASYIILFLNLFYSSLKDYAYSQCVYPYVRDCVILSPCKCCSAASGDWVSYNVLCTLDVPGGSTFSEERILFIYEITQCECQPCSSAYILNVCDI